MSSELIVHHKTERIAWITLNRPLDGNAINHRLANELADCCLQIRQDDEIGAVVIAGAGEHFCSGSDLGELASCDPAELRGMNPASVASKAVAGLDCAVIAAVGGDCLGGGLELALCCDIRICSEDARFGFPEVGYGLIPGGGGTQRLPRIVGKGKATEMILIGEPIDAGEAYRTGLVSRVVPGDRVSEVAEEVARRLIARGPVAVRYAKEAVNKGADMTLDQGLRLEADLSILLQSTEDRAEGIRAFLEKRTASFKGC